MNSKSILTQIRNHHGILSLTHRKAGELRKDGNMFVVSKVDIHQVYVLVNRSILWPMSSSNAASNVTNNHLNEYDTIELHCQMNDI